MEGNRIIEEIKKLTEGYKGEDDTYKRLNWLKNLIESYKRYLPSRVVEKIELDPLAKKVEGERRNITVAFADLSGFTALSETMDPEDIANIINDFFTRMLKIVFKYEGSVDKFLGDALMVLFGAPVAHHDDPERAVRAALEMQQEMKKFNEEKKFKQPLSMSIGINTGQAVALNVGSDERMEYTVIGDTVNLSARLEKVAQAGEIIISNYTYQHIADVVDAEKRPSVKVKGKKKPIQIYLVKGMNEHYRLSDIIKLKLIGRKQELETIQSVINKVKTEKGMIIGIVGDPGAGKTRLGVESLFLSQKNGFTVLNARCMSYRIDEPFSAVLDILNGYFNIKKETKEEEKKLLISLKLKNLGMELDETLPYICTLYGIRFPQIEKIPPEELKKRIFAVIKKIIYRESENTPLALRIEDLQWSDPTSNELFDCLIADMNTVPLLLIFEYRSDYAFPWLRLKNCTTISLNNFPKEETEEYIKRLLDTPEIEPGLTDSVYEKSQGNPLFTQEIIKFLLKKGGIRRHKGRVYATNRFRKLDIAESISGVILDQIDRMSEAERRVLQYASILGKTFKPPLLSRILDIPESELQPELDSLEHFEGILTSHIETDGKSYEFISPTTYEVVYGSLLKKRRKELHSRIGKILEELFSDRLYEYLEELAYHFVKSTDEEKGIEYSKSAAEKSYRLYALKESIHFFQQTLELLNKKELSKNEMQNKLEILRKQGWVFKLLANMNEALLAQKRSLRLAHKMGSLKDEAGACLNIGIIYQEMGVPKKGLSYWTRARRTAKKIGDKRIEVLALNNLGNYYLHAGDYGKALDYFVNAEELSSKMNDKKAMALANSNIGDLLERKGDLPKALDYYNKACDLFEEIGEKENITRCLNQMGLINLWLGNMDSAMKKLDNARELASEIGDKVVESLALGNIGLAYAQMWRLDKAFEKFSEALTIAKITGEPQQNMFMNNNIGDVYQYQGRIKEAFDYHKNAIEIAEAIQDPLNEAIARRSFGWDWFYTGDYKSALEQFHKSREIFNKIGDQKNSVISTIAVAAVENKIGLYDEVENKVNNIEKKAREINDLEILTLILDLKSEFLIAQQRYKNMKTVFEELPDLCRKIGNKRLYAWTFGRLARIMVLKKEFDRVDENIQKSISLSTELGDRILQLYNNLTNARLTIHKENYPETLNILMKTTDQARNCSAREYLAAGLWLTAEVFKKLGNTQEEEKYRSEYERIISLLTEHFKEPQKTSIREKIEVKI